MKRPVANTFAVLVATVVTALAIFGGVQLAGMGLSPSAGTYANTAQPATVAAVASSGALQYCPRTGCAATSCHGAAGLPPGR
ncbi:MAG: hypothetical protein CVT67_04275 [Actinobacteria bacterium HGW-Actinobacteria-7]|jgi:hypothetical protein|nr:MAG: hypothetical protein CVT67_04275 [Actinobacteria bacterium HGW-Actinobacteria-7]